MPSTCRRSSIPSGFQSRSAGFGVLLAGLVVLSVVSAMSPPVGAAIVPITESGDFLCGWDDAYAVPGPGGEVEAFRVFDDGTGPGLYAGGDFEWADERLARGIARWDGSEWSALEGPLGVGVQGGIVRALAVFDAGSGPALFAAGTFTSAGGRPASRIARWDGTDWSALGAGVSGEVTAMAVVDFGSGPALYVAGSFESAGGIEVGRIARWDGATWSALSGPSGTGVDGTIDVLAVVDVGGEPQLVAGGAFTMAGGFPASGIARWTGTRWKALPEFEGPPSGARVSTLAVFDDGAGEGLVAHWSTGQLSRWEGGSWISVAPPPFDTFELFVVDRGAGEELHAVRQASVSTWNGTTWSADDIVAHGLVGVNALAGFDGGAGPRLLSAGTGASGRLSGVWERRSSGWAPLGNGRGFQDLQGGATELAAWSREEGPVLLAAGSFVAFDGAVAAPYVAALDADGWSGLGDFTDDEYPVWTLSSNPSWGLGGLVGSSEPSLPGVFAAPPSGSVATWDGSSWQARPEAGGGPVTDLAIHDDGSGLSVFRSRHLAGVSRWNGSSWQTVTGSSGVGVGDPTVWSMAVHDDGSGPALYVGIDSAVGGSGVRHWDGTSWSSVVGSSATVPDRAFALNVLDLGDGPELFASDGVQIHRWDGTSWAKVGAPIGAFHFSNLVWEIDSFDEGTGPVIWASTFDGPRRWDGAAWTAPPGWGDSLIAYDIQRLDLGDGERMWILAEGLTEVGGVPTSGVASWGCIPRPPVDRGDAPDPTYPTLEASDGASHEIVVGFHLGSGVDADDDGQPTGDATGDDADGTDDDDGVVFPAPLVPGVSTGVEVTASGAGVLDAWVDFDGDGSWSGPGERIFTAEPLVAGVNSLSVGVPATAHAGTTIARFRLSSTGVTAPTGAAVDGEVEDHTVTIERPSIAVTKSASPTSVDEPGGPVTFTVAVTNTGTAAVDLASLVDDLEGDLHGLGTCSLPRAVGIGATTSCSYTATVSGNAGDTVSGTVTAAGTSAGVPVLAQGSATVTISDVGSSIVLTTTASPTSLDEPGGDVTWTVDVSNASAVDEVTITSLVDDLLGSLDGLGSCSVPRTLAPSASFRCSHVAAVSGDAGVAATHTVTASGADDDGSAVSAQDAATVTVTDVLPTGSVTVTASPTTIDEPGGDVTFTVVVSNGSPAETLVLSALSADLHGDLDGQGTCALPQSVAASGSFTCSYTTTVSGIAGDLETTTVTATVSDDDGNTITPGDAATVTVVGTDWGDAPDPTYPTLLASNGARHAITAGFHLGASVDADPDGRPDATATGDDDDGTDDEDGVVFVSALVPGLVADVEVTASQAGVLDAWIDLDRDGTWSAPEKVLDGTSLSAGSQPLSFGVPGTAASGATVARFRLTSAGIGEPFGPAPDGEVEDHAVTIHRPSLSVSAIAGPASRPEPGGTVAIRVTVRNTGTADVTLGGLGSDVRGDLDGQGDCSVPTTIPPLGTFVCIYPSVVGGNAGDAITETVTATGSSVGIPVAAEGSVTVPITDVPSSLAVTKGHLPDPLSEPGGDVTFTVVVDNTSAVDAVTVSSLVDDVHGDLDGQGTCSVPRTLGAAASTSCTYTAAVNGNAGESQTSTVTASATDDDGNPLSASGTATVSIADVLPLGEVTFTAAPNILTEPGGAVTFTVEVRNRSAAESLSLTSLADDVDGDLDGRGSCAIPQSIAASGSFSCSFTTTVSGDAGDVPERTVTATLSDDEGNAIAPSESARVWITGTDRGDAPDPPFRTLRSRNGPQHAISAGFFLGSGVDHDDDGQPNADASGDDVDGNDDDDGVIFTATLVPGATVGVEVTASEQGVLDGWIDFDQDGAWERLYEGVALSAGVNELSLAVPVSAPTGATSARFRFTRSGIDFPFGSAPDGEVEDYRVSVERPSIAVVKDASPVAVTEPGGDVTFSVAVTNTGTAPVDLSSLTDDVHGDLDGRGDCSLPQVLGVGSTSSCSFVATVSGNGAGTETGTVTAVGTSAGLPVSASDSATVTIEDILPRAGASMTASPPSVDEPGGDVTFTVQLTNASLVEPIVVTDLTSNLAGNLDGQGTCSVPRTIPGGGAWACDFSATISGGGGDSQTMTVTAQVADDDGNSRSVGPIGRTVTIADLPSSLALTLTPSPASIDEPGGDVTLTVEVTNTSAVDEVTLSALTEDTLGVLHGRGTCSLPHVLAASAAYDCAVTAPVSGGAGDSPDFRVVVVGLDDDGSAVGSEGSATVTIEDVAPSATLSVAASPTTVDEPGGAVTFTVEVTNASTAEALEMSALSSDLQGDLDGQGTCSLPQTIAAGDTLACSYTATVSGSAGDAETTTVTATASDDDGGTVTPSGSATVTVAGTDWGDAPDPAYPTLEASDGARHTIEAGFFLGSGVDADADGQPTGDATGDDGDGTEDEDGVVFAGPLVAGTTVDVEVTASRAGLLDAWLDLDGDGSWSEAEERIFTAEALAPGPNDLTVAVPAAASTGSTVARFRLSSRGVAAPTGRAVDGEVEDHAVSIERPSIAVTKTASPTTVDEPGGDVTFTVEVANTGTTTVDLGSLVDDVHGDLDGQGTCALPQVVGVGSASSCSYSTTVFGDAGDSSTSTATATGTSLGVPVSAQGAATVTITDVAPSATLSVIASPEIVDEPGGEVTFTVEVTNASTAEALELGALSSDLHGDLDGQGTCSLPQAIVAGDTLACSFTATVSGSAGDAETTTVTAMASDDDGGTVTPSGSATVTVAGTDWGDAPDPTYPTLEASDGARHAIDAGFFLGTGVDADADGQPSDDATGDDAEGTEDEDGVVFAGPLVAGTTVHVEVTASRTGLLDAWLDFDGDGTWSETEERIFTAEALVSGPNELSVAIPAAATTGTTVARFRLSSLGVAAPTGLATDGEVEDHAVSIERPSIAVTKTASPTIVDEPGGDVTFTVDVANTGTTPVDLGSLVDDVHGDLDGQGTCALPQTIGVGDTLSCIYDATVSGEGGEAETGTVTATGVSAGRTVVDSASATVTVRDVASSLVVSLAASPTTVEEPGGDVAWTVSVTNTSPVDEVTVTTLVDDAIGDLDGRGTCTLPQILEASVSFACTYTAAVSGNAGDAPIHTVTASGTDDDGVGVSSQDAATVGITDVLPTGTMGVTASPSTLEEPGGDVAFSVSVTNDSAAEALELKTLSSDVHGDLDGLGTCAVPRTIAVGGSFTCHFAAEVSGAAGESETTTVTAALSDDEGTVVSASGSATVTIAGTDWGDAPDPVYPTLEASDGARHAITAGFHLGSGIDAESDGQPSANADGDDSDGTDDEDGVVFTGPLAAGTEVTVEVTASREGFLDAWVDLDGDGSWSGPGEEIFDSEELQPGVNALVFPIPTGILLAGESVARFRLSSVGGLSPTGPASDGEVEDLIVTNDTANPEIERFQAVPGTADGELSSCETTTRAPSALAVVFSETLQTGTGPEAADDPDNYRIFATGPNRTFDTGSCGPAELDDVAVSVAGVEYAPNDPEAPSSRALLGLDGALPDGLYRVVVCGTLEDLGGRPLAGGADALLDFRVDAGNLLVNGNFDCDLSGWESDPSLRSPLHDPLDREGSPESGSARFSSPTGGEELAFGVCSSEAVAGSGGIRFGANLRVDAASALGVSWLQTCTFYDGPDCGGADLGNRIGGLLLRETDSVFVSAEKSFDPPEAARSLFCEHRFESPDPWDAFLDGAWLRTEPHPIFSDGFESGDASAWEAP